MIRKGLRKACRSIGLINNTAKINMIKPKVLLDFFESTYNVECNNFARTIQISQFIEYYSLTDRPICSLYDVHKKEIINQLILHLCKNNEMYEKLKQSKLADHERQESSCSHNSSARNLEKEIKMVQQNYQEFSRTIDQFFDATPVEGSIENKKVYVNEIVNNKKEFENLENYENFKLNRICHEGFNPNYLELRENEEIGPKYVLTRTTGSTKHLIRANFKTHEEKENVNQNHKFAPEPINSGDFNDKENELVNQESYWFTSESFKNGLNSLTSPNNHNRLSQLIEHDNKELNENLKSGKKDFQTFQVDFDFKNEKDRALLFILSFNQTKLMFWDKFSNLSPK